MKAQRVVRLISNWHILLVYGQNPRILNLIKYIKILHIQVSHNLFIATSAHLDSYDRTDRTLLMFRIVSWPRAVKLILQLRSN